MLKVLRLLRENSKNPLRCRFVGEFKLNSLENMVILVFFKCKIYAIKIRV